MNPDLTSPADPLRAAAQAAMYAPSVHNSQPWRFAVHDCLEVFADRTRALLVIDRALPRCGPRPAGLDRTRPRLCVRAALAPDLAAQGEPQ